LTKIKINAETINTVMLWGMARHSLIEPGIWEEMLLLRWIRALSEAEIQTLIIIYIEEAGGRIMG
jgi:hypothetical protein